MNVRKQRSLVGNCLKFKLEEDFEVRNFKYLWKTVDRNVECSTKYGQLYGMWWGSTILPARQKKIFEWVWTCMKWIKFECQVLHLSEFAHWNQIWNSKIRNKMNWNKKYIVSDFEWPVSARYYFLCEGFFISREMSNRDVFMCSELER